MSDTDNQTISTAISTCTKEERRFQEVLDYDLENFDIEDKGLQAITTLAAIICGTPLSFVTLVKQTYVDFLSRVGIPLCGTGRENSFCNLAIEQDEFFEICDSTKDPRFEENVFVKNQEKPLKYYGGYPLKTPNGYNLGSLCVCDWDEKKLTDVQILALKTLSEQVVVHLELRKQNKKLNEALAKAEKLSRAKDDFVSNMSHELRTPLNAINGFADVILKTSLDTEQKDAIGIIKSSSEILITLINDILDFSKIESGKLAIEKIPFNLRKAMKNIKDLLNKKSDEKGNLLKLQIDENIPELLMGDKVRINQVIVNLVGNALKFTEKGTVTVGISVVEESPTDIRLLFSVKDTGIGIPEDKLDSIFERFEQAGKETHRKYGGTGLGLNISKNIVSLHNGSLKVKSKLGEGSEFYFIITYDKVNEEEELKKSLVPKATLQTLNSLDNISILICEDNNVNIKLIKNLFRNKQTKLEIAENGKIAISILQRVKNFDVILMDLHMPEMDGIETTQYIRNVMKLKIPIIGFTANNSPAEREMCLKNGMDEYITKTFVYDEFYERLSKALPLKKYKEDDDGFDVVRMPKRRINSSKNVLSRPLETKKLSSKNVTRKLSTNEALKYVLKKDNAGTISYLPQEQIINGLYNTKTEIRETSSSESSDDEDFDNTCLNEYSSGDTEFERDIISIFLEDFSDHIDGIGKGLRENDLKPVKFNVHKLKTSLTMLGFHHILEKLLNIEKLFETVPVECKDAIAKQFGEVNAEVEVAVRKLKEYAEKIR